MNEEVSKDTEDQSQEEQNPLEKLAEALKDFPGSPGQEQISQWKLEFGDVYCSAFTDEEIFIWRPMGRLEWKNYQLRLSQMEEADAMNSEEELVSLCLLWHSEKAKVSLVKKAGSVSTLQEQILQNSNFVDPRVASQLVLKL